MHASLGVESVSDSPSRSLSFGTALLLIVGAGCAGGERAACRADDEQYSSAIVRVYEARDLAGLMRVQGTILAQGESIQLCSLVDGSRPPNCQGSSLRVEGLSDLTAFEEVEREGEVAWAREVVIGGRVTDGRISVEPYCRTRRVMNVLEDETRESVVVDAFTSNESVEVVHLKSQSWGQSVSSNDTYNSFEVYVRTPHEKQSLLDSLQVGDVAPDRGDARWSNNAGQWIAYKSYGADVVMSWVAGGEQRLDDRWKGLDRALSSAFD